MKRVYYIFLLIACVFSSALIIPVIRNNVDDPSMIVYFSADEGDFMDLTWYYYSGEKRPSFQWEYDYGLEKLYVSDFARLVLSHFIDIEPGTFVLILRCAYFTAWLLSFVALWRLVSRHFGGGWKPALAVILLAVRPAFIYFSNTLKPDPIVLLFIILGLDYTLRLVDHPGRRRYLLTAILFACLAFLVKFAGLFLLPAIIGAMYIINRSKGVKEGRPFPLIKFSWVYEAVIGTLLISLLYFMIFFYIRKSTGKTFYEEFGLLNSLYQNKMFMLIMLAGILLILLSLWIWWLGRSEKRSSTKIMRAVNEINSYALAVTGIFAVMTIVLGFRWFTVPKVFIEMYSEYGSIFLGGETINAVSLAEFTNIFWQNLISKIVSLDAVVLMFFISYLFVEYSLRRGSGELRTFFFKRMILIVFLAPFLLSLLSIGRMAQIHMLPFFVAMSILAIEGIHMLYVNSRSMSRKAAIVSIASLLFIFDISVNATETVREGLYAFYQRKDVVFELSRWWRQNIPLDAMIVADHYNRVYIPEGYKNVKTIFLSGRDIWLKELRALVEKYRPDYIYYNEMPSGGERMPTIEEALPDKKVKLLAAFDNKGRGYLKRANDRFVIYKVVEK